MFLLIHISLQCTSLHFNHEALYMPQLSHFSELFQIFIKILKQTLKYVINWSCLIINFRDFCHIANHMIILIHIFSSKYTFISLPNFILKSYPFLSPFRRFLWAKVGLIISKIMSILKISNKLQSPMEYFKAVEKSV